VTVMVNIGAAYIQCSRSDRTPATERLLQLNALPLMCVCVCVCSRLSLPHYHLSPQPKAGNRGTSSPVPHFKFWGHASPSGTSFLLSTLVHNNNIYSARAYPSSDAIRGATRGPVLLVHVMVEVKCLEMRFKNR